MDGEARMAHEARVMRRMVAREMPYTDLDRAWDDHLDAMAYGFNACHGCGRNHKECEREPCARVRELAS